MSPATRSCLSWLPLAAFATGCGSQVSNEYYGESLLALRGSVIVENINAPGNLVPVLAYERAVEGTSTYAFELADVVYRGDFPARFELGVFEPPPSEAFQEIETPLGRTLNYAWGRVGAVTPRHPQTVARTNDIQLSYCLGKECFIERERCPPVAGDCYRERERCSLPARFDSPAPAYSNCREIGSSGDLSTLEPAPKGGAGSRDATCTGDTCQLTYEWCGDDGLVCEPDGTCDLAGVRCHSRVVECAFDEARFTELRPAADEIDHENWMQRGDLGTCNVITQLGNLDLAENMNEWFAGLSDDVYVAYLHEGFDPAAFEERVGVPAPSQTGYSLFALEPWNERNRAGYLDCRTRTEAPMIDAYNAEHGTTYTLEEGVPAHHELGEMLLDNMQRCNLSVRGEWLADPASRELNLSVSLPWASPR